MCWAGATWFGRTSAKGTTGDASARITGPAQIRATSNQRAGRTRPSRGRWEVSGRTRTPAATTTSSAAPTIGQRNRPTLPSASSSARSRTIAPPNPASTRSARPGSGARRSARTRTAPAATLRTIAADTSSAAGTVTASCPAIASITRDRSKPSVASEARSQTPPEAPRRRPAGSPRGRVPRRASRAGPGATRRTRRRRRSRPASSEPLERGPRRSGQPSGGVYGRARKSDAGAPTERGRSDPETSEATLSPGSDPIGRGQTRSDAVGPAWNPVRPGPELRSRRRATRPRAPGWRR